jgi:glycosyltransferase involved in cell wall biosynthesis
MNVFVIPSWYPSESNPSYGIFIKEQVEMMARLRPNWKIGVSLWGQGDSDKLLWVRDHFINVGKVKRHAHDESKKHLDRNIIEYYQPALSWTKRFLKGNLNEIVRCNELNFQHYVMEFGPPDVILIQGAYPGSIVGSYLSEKYDIPYLVHVRLGGFMFEKLLKEVAGMKDELINSINSAKRVLVTSSFQREGLKKWILESFVIHNPVDTSFFNPESGGGKYIAAIGRLEEEKGFDILIDAMAKIPNVKLKIAGDGSMKKALIKRVKNHQLSDRIEFVGELTRVEVRELISHSQFLVLSSRYETFGNVLLEALACGKPVVSTRCGGPEEIVTDTSGYLSEINANDLGATISKMIENLSDFDSAEIKKEVEKKFAPIVWMDRLESLLK